MSKPSQIRSAAISDGFIKGLFYGYPGIGKTRFAGTSPKCLILECGKAETDTCAAAGQPVDVWEVHTKANLTDAYEYLRHEGHNDYEWVWIDGITPLDQRLMREQLDLVHAANPSKRSDLVPDKPDYLIVQSTIRRFAQWFVDLPMNVGFTAHVMLENMTTIDEDNDELEVLQLMPQVQGGRGKLAQELCGMMNIVGYMDKTGPEAKTRGMLVLGDSRHVAKDRFNCLGGESGWFMNPTVPKMQKLVAEAIGKGPKKVPVKKAVKKATKATAKKATAPVGKAAGLRRK